ncbi:MAG: hypothetical protein ACKO34_01455, partial [Vampirovibrionales bacterium]
SLLYNPQAKLLTFGTSATLNTSQDPYQGVQKSLIEAIQLYTQLEKISPDILANATGTLKRLHLGVSQAENIYAYIQGKLGTPSSAMSGSYLSLDTLSKKYEDAPFFYTELDSMGHTLPKGLHAVLAWKTKQLDFATPKAKIANILNLNEAQLAPWLSTPYG